VQPRQRRDLPHVLSLEVHAMGLRGVERNGAADAEFPHDPAELDHWTAPVAWEVPEAGLGPLRAREQY